MNKKQNNKIKKEEKMESDVFEAIIKEVKMQVYALIKVAYCDKETITQGLTYNEIEQSAIVALEELLTEKKVK